MVKKGLIIEKFKLYPITFTLIVINIIVFLIPQMLVDLYDPFYNYGALNVHYVIVQGEWHRLFTSIFLHADMMHIVMNMLSLYMVGTMVERLFSKEAYLSLYFISALFGSFASMFIHDSWAVGASGAIFGIFGALAGFAWIHRDTMRSQFTAFMKDFGMILLLNIGIGLAFPSIDMSAHIGGLIAGLLGGMLIALNPKYLWIYLIGSFLLLLGAYEFLASLT